MAKQIDITKDLYLCSPLLNKKCSKENCYINNGCCCHTVKKEYSQEYLFDYITNLQEENERLKKENQDFVVEQNALAYYLVKQGLSFEDIVKIINDFKNE